MMNMLSDESPSKYLITVKKTIRIGLRHGLFGKRWYKYAKDGDESSLHRLSICICNCSAATRHLPV